MWLLLFYALGVCYTGIVMQDVMPFVPVGVPREHKLWSLLSTMRIVSAVAFAVFWPVLWFVGGIRLIWRAVAFVGDVFIEAFSNKEDD